MTAPTAPKKRRFDPEPDKNYGKCNTCKIDLVTEQDARTHMRETFEARTSGNSGHSVRIQNANRRDRIQQEVGGFIEGAIYDVMEKCWDLVNRKYASEDEITRSLHDPFREEWLDQTKEQG